jgi:hypothetical protein
MPPLLPLRSDLLTPYSVALFGKNKKAAFAGGFFVFTWNP